MIDFFQISRDGEHVGNVTSPCHSPRLEKNIGYAMIPIELAQLGAELEVDVAGDRREAVVVEMPSSTPRRKSPSNGSRPSTDRQDRRSVRLPSASAPGGDPARRRRAGGDPARPHRAHRHRHLLTHEGHRGDACALRAARGLRVPGRAASRGRLVADRAHLRELLARLSDLGVRDVFVVAGDIGQPAGEFEGAAPLLAAMADLGNELDEVGITGYPESHAFISDETTIQTMFDKAALATYIVRQICFDAELIGRWIRRVRDRGLELPIHIGLPGPVAASRLLRLSGRIGLGESARVLHQHGNWVGRLLLPAPTARCAAQAPDSPSRLS